LLLVFFELVSDIGRVIAPALLIDQDRQIAADPEGIHVIEEEKAIGAKQILHIVFGGRQEDVDALVFEQGVESRRVEGRGLYRIMSSFMHVLSSAAASLRKICAIQTRECLRLVLLQRKSLPALFGFANSFRLCRQPEYLLNR
jgi:hypothetical protein